MKLYLTDGDGAPHQDAEGCACLEIHAAAGRWFPFRSLHRIRAPHAVKLLQSFIYRAGTRPSRTGDQPGDAGYAAAKVADYCRRFPYGVIEIF